MDALLAGPDRADLRWSVTLGRPTLGAFQRIMTRISIRVDAKEIQQRHSEGVLVFVAEFQDAAKKTYRTHMQVGLSQNVDASPYVGRGLQAFLLPGDYRLALAVFDPRSNQSSVTHRMLHVPLPKSDPLPNAWRSLPAVEFVGMQDMPDRWFLPENRNRLDLHVNNPHPPSIAILANIAPSEASRRQRRTFDRNLSAIVPALKILSQITGTGTREIKIVDVMRRQVVFQQLAPAELDWAKLRPVLQENSPNKIPVAALKDRDQDLKFFGSEASRLAAGAGERRVLIVMSAPVAFAARQDAHPVGAAPNATVFYLRFQTAALWPFTLEPTRATTPQGVPDPLIQPSSLPVDELAGALKPLRPVLIDIFSPGKFREALAAILKQLEQ